MWPCRPAPSARSRASAVRSVSWCGRAWSRRSSRPATTHSVRTLPAPDPHPLPERSDLMTAPSPGRLTPLDDALALGIGAQSGPVPVLSTLAPLQPPSARVISADRLAPAHGAYEASLNGSQCNIAV